MTPFPKPDVAEVRRIKPVLSFSLAVQEHVPTAVILMAPTPPVDGIEALAGDTAYPQSGDWVTE